MLFVPGLPACIKRWRFLARFLSSFAAFRTCRFKSERRWRRSAISWCSKAWPAHESCTMSKCWYHAQVQIETKCFCCISELTHSVTLSRTVLSRGKGTLVSETLPTCCARRPRFPARKTQLKSSTLTRSSQATPTTSQFPESAWAGEGGLFLGRLDQGLVGNAESTHVDRPKGMLEHLFNPFVIQSFF